MKAIKRTVAIRSMDHIDEIFQSLAKLERRAAVKSNKKIRKNVEKASSLLYDAYNAIYKKSL